ncbi:C4-dicarboxylate TRAP transporter substrate-binding protein [Pelagibius sp. Alg239-R121]|uniref:C4-dicarboxylate TRAP transporter substrate-binding protein n=1 Tax=Pelagibius sp. Alg239-R121 TaxID=2993448 RepID=UPI0024A63633|nr:C4-dicarboxylate TRAP transporter substrate-binding protein [Pelagibius sp. Alg239-R121]
MSLWTKFAGAATAAAVAGAAVLTTGVAVRAETVLTYAEASPNRGARAKALNWFADEIAKRSNGDLKIEFQWGGALFDAKSALKGIGDGVADMGSVIAAYVPKQMHALAVADLPLGNPDGWVGMRATYDIALKNEALKASFDKQNVGFVAAFSTSAVQIACKGDAIRTVEDIKGKKVRGIGAYGKVFKDFGANMVRMSIYKAYQGLDTGLIDCSQGYTYAIRALKQYEVSDSLTIFDWGQIGAFVMFGNKDSLAALSDSQRAVLREVSGEFADHYGAMLEKANTAAEKAFTDGIDGRKVEIIRLEASERAKLLEASKKYVSEWVSKANDNGMPGDAVLAEYQGLIAKYQTERDEKGYPWAR